VQRKTLIRPWIVDRVIHPPLMNFVTPTKTSVLIEDLWPLENVICAVVDELPYDEATRKIS
jgi:hypothetical protein